MKSKYLLLLAVLAVSAAQAATVFVPGYLKYEYFPGSDRPTVEAGGVAPSTGGTTVGSDKSGYTTLFLSGNGFADNYANRFSGLFVPPTTGDYVFFVAGDDDCDLFLSTDDTAANKKLIAQEQGWSNEAQWTTTPSGDATAKRSDQFTGNKWPGAPTIHLTAGNKYYIEGVHHEGGGGDNFSATYILSGAADPADGTPTVLRGNVIGVNAPAPTSLTITNQPKDASVFAGTSASFSVGASTDSLFPTGYQWRRNGTNIAGATGSRFAPVTAAGDNGAKFDVVLTVPGITVTSTVANLTIKSGAITVAGSLKHEFFSGQTRGSVESGAAGAPTYIEALSSFRTGVNFADNYANRISGYFTPATSGKYVFFVASDDDSDLFLSTDDTPANKRLIAQETGWSNEEQWTTTPSGSAPQKRSDQWSPDGGTTVPYAAGIDLTAGTKYYIEGVHHEGGGGDNFGATFKLAGDPDPTDGAATKLTNGVISYITGPVSSGTIATQPVGVTNYETQGFKLSVGVQTDSELTPLYQWRRAGTNIAGATGASYNVGIAGLTDSGSYDVVINIPNSSISLTSAPVTVLVQSAPLLTGLLKYEYFPGSDRPTVEGGTVSPSSPGNTLGSDKSGAIDSFKAGNGFADNYANRISGLFIPPVDGNYVFFVNGDDDCDLFLSTDDSPANKKLIAQEQGWSNERQWTTTPSGDATAKRSDTFTGTQWPGGNTIALKKGQKYYLEGVHHEGGGGDNFGAYYKLDTDPDPTDGDATTLTNGVIAIKVPPQPITITQAPQNVSKQVAQNATFTIVAATTGFYPLNIQWNKNGTAIPGATGTNYTTAPLTTADNNTKYTATLSILGTLPQTTPDAVLTVTPDTTAPTISSVAGTLQTVTINFSEPLEAASAGTASNYKIDGGVTVTSATPTDLSPLPTVAFTSVQLAVSGATGGKAYTLTVSGVKDKSGNTIAANTTAPFTVYSAVFDFNTGLPAGSTIGGTALILPTGGPDGSGMLQLTAPVGSQQGGFSFPDFVNGAAVSNFTASFKLFLGKAGGGTADGFSFNFAPDISGTDNVGEEGTGSGISVDFDTYNNGNTGPLDPVSGTQVAEAPAVEVKYGGEIIGFVAVPIGTLVNDQWVDVLIQLNSDNTISVTHNGSNYFNHLALQGTNLTTGVPIAATYAPISGGTFLVGARTGGAWEEADVDNMTLLENGTVQNSGGGGKATLTIKTATGGGLTISWAPTGGTLQSTSALTGPATTTWTDVGTANPATITIGSGAKFYRVNSPNSSP